MLTPLGLPLSVQSFLSSLIISSFIEGPKSKNCLPCVSWVRAFSVVAPVLGYQQPEKYKTCRTPLGSTGYGRLLFFRQPWVIVIHPAAGILHLCLHYPCIVPYLIVDRFHFSQNFLFFKVFNCILWIVFIRCILYAVSSPESHLGEREWI